MVTYHIGSETIGIGDLESKFKVILLEKDNNNDEILVKCKKKNIFCTLS